MRKILQTVFIVTWKKILGFFKIPTHAEMPLSDTSGVIPVLLHVSGNGKPIRSDQGISIEPDNTPLQRRPPVVSSGEHAVSRRRAYGGARVGIGEYHAFTGEAVKLRCRNFTVRIEAGHIAVPHIVNEEIKDIWTAFHENEDISFISGHARGGALFKHWLFGLLFV